MSIATTVQLHAAEKFDNWIIQDWSMQMDIWKKAYTNLGTEFAHGYTDFRETLALQNRNDKAALAWAMFALSVLTAGAGTLIAPALAEASLVKQLAASTGQTAGIELIKEKMASGADDGSERPGRYQAFAESVFGGKLPHDVQSMLKMEHAPGSVPAYSAHIGSALRAVESIQDFNHRLLDAFVKHMVAQKSHLVLMKDALTPLDGSVGQRWLSEAGGSEEGAMRAVEVSIINARHALFRKWKMYGNLPYFSYRANFEFEKTLWAMWILRQKLHEVAKIEAWSRDVEGAGYWTAPNNLNFVGQVRMGLGDLKPEKMLRIGDDVNRRLAKVGITVPHSVWSAKQGYWQNAHRGINTVGHVDTPMESRKLRDWAKTFRPSIKMGRDVYKARSFSESPQQAIAKHAKMLDIYTGDLGRREFDHQ